MSEMTDEEYQATKEYHEKARERETAKKLIQNLSKDDYVTNLYGEDKRLVTKALNLYLRIEDVLDAVKDLKTSLEKDSKPIEEALELKKNLEEEIRIFQANTDLETEPYYWVKEKYHLGRLLKLKRGEKPTSI